MKHVYRIMVKNFDEINDRSLNKTLPWFKCYSKLARSSKFLSLSSGAKHMWLWLLCEASQSTTRIAYVSPKDISSEIHVRPKSVPGVIQELTSLEWIHIVSSPDTKQKHPYIRREEKREEEMRREPPAGSENGPQPVLTFDPRSLKKSKPKPNTDANRKTWEAYRDAYKNRWKVEPTRNQVVNCAIANFVKRLGEQDAPEVIKFFVSHNDGLYLKTMHDVKLALRDAEALRGQWLKGRAITSKDVRDYEKASTYQVQMEKLERGEL